jgi:hypothetical protein
VHADHKDAMDCLLYIELNAVRAGIVKRPEEYEGGSLYYREIKKDGWMMPLSKIVINSVPNYSIILMFET